ncbi:MAG: FecR domain-containing protein [Nitrospira sp.]|nr:FecR domain-containing protein [Nitrospira sp.]
MAACVLLVAGAALWLALVLWPLGDYRTAVGEQRTIALPDGSTVQLNTDTALSVAITDDLRRSPSTAGKPSAPSPRTRPFEVTASHGTIRALGTAFNVRTDGDRTAVAVSEHRDARSPGTRTVHGRPSRRTAALSAERMAWIRGTNRPEPYVGVATASPHVRKSTVA